MTSIRTAQNSIFQAKKFWSSVLFGPQLKLTSITNRIYSDGLLDDLVEWLRDLFGSPSIGWLLVSASRNPYSEIFFFTQNDCSNLPTKLVVKRFMVQLENGSEFYLKGFKQESQGFKGISKFSGRYSVFTPKLYGQNLDLCLIATSFEEGRPLFNVLFQSPVKQIIGKSQDLEFRKSLSNLGRWLREVHTSNSFLPKKNEKVKAILDKDLAGIEVRIRHLKESRPNDFPSSLCERILVRASDLAGQILLENPSVKNVHGDFCLTNMLYSAGKLRLLDFASLGPGMPEDDLCRIYLDLRNVEAYTYMFTPRRKGSLTSAFFSGYGKEIDCKLDASVMFHVIKHSIINTYMYTKFWGNRQFLNPFLCRIFYTFQRNVLLRQINL